MSSPSTSSPNGLTLRDRQGNRIGTLSAASMLGWLAIVGPIVLVAERTLTTAPTAPWWPAVLLVLLAVASADLPDSLFPLATVLVAGSWWIAVVDHLAIGAALVVALSLLVFHVATGHAATGPPGRVDDITVVTAVLVRTAPVAVMTLALAAVAGAPTGRVVVPAGTVVPALLAVGALPWLARHVLRSGDAGH